MTLCYRSNGTCPPTAMCARYREYLAISFMATVRRNTYFWRNDPITATPSWRTSWALMLHRLTEQNACSYLHSLFSSLPYLCYTLRRSTGACCLQATHRCARWSHGRCYSGAVRCLAVSFMGRVISTSSRPGNPLHSDLS